MAKPRELKRRIRSVQNTKKITKTMELVSTSKLKRAQDRVVGARPYAQALAEVIGQLYSPELAERLCDAFAAALRERGYDVQTGKFGAHMEVDLCNDGPVTLVLSAGEGPWPANAG